MHAFNEDRHKLAATMRLLYAKGFVQESSHHATVRLGNNVILVNPIWLGSTNVTSDSLVEVNVNGTSAENQNDRILVNQTGLFSYF